MSFDPMSQTVDRDLLLNNAAPPSEARSRPLSRASLRARSSIHPRTSLSPIPEEQSPWHTEQVQIARLINKAKDADDLKDRHGYLERINYYHILMKAKLEEHVRKKLQEMTGAEQKMVEGLYLRVQYHMHAYRNFVVATKMWSARAAHVTSKHVVSKLEERPTFIDYFDDTSAPSNRLQAFLRRWSRVTELVFGRRHQGEEWRDTI